MKYLITGANGFIGSYLTRYLLDLGHEVFATSRKFFPEIKINLEGATFIDADLLSNDFEKISLEIDAIIHLASSNDQISKDRTKGIELSSIGTSNLLDFAVRNKIEKFIFFSTLQVYGDELVGHYSEESLIAPVNDYGINHIFGEKYCEMYCRKFDIKTLIIRPSNIYGPFLSKSINRWTLVPGCFCKEGFEKRSITLLSSGKQIRNFITLEQLSYETEQAARVMSKPYDVLNFVSNEYYSIVDMARMVKEVFQESFGKEVELIISSDEPKKGSNFHFSHEKLNNYEIDVGSIPSNPKEQIRQVIETLLV